MSASKTHTQKNKSRKPWISHVTLNLTVYWLSIDNLTYPTNHATRRVTGIYYNILYTTNILGTERKIPLGGKP